MQVLVIRSAILLLWCFASASALATNLWIGGSGDWNIDGNWSAFNPDYPGSGIPRENSELQINTGTAFVITADAFSDYVNIGMYSGDNGAVQVLNGFAWLNSNTVNVGVLGTGTLTVGAGGELLGSIVVGAGTGGQGTLNLNGTSGSRGVLFGGIIKGIEAGGGHINFNGGILRAAEDSTDFLWGFDSGDVQILSGGAFFDTNGHVVTINSTVQFGGSGGITKLGVGALTLSGDRTYSGDNTVEEGSLINASSYLGYGSSETSSMTVTGPGSGWSNESLYVGYSGGGTLNISNGGSVNYSYGYIGSISSGEGTATVDGVGSELRSSGGNLVVGETGFGTLNVQNGGTARNSSGFIGFGAGSEGTVTVKGAGSQWNNDIVFVGGYGTGELTIQNGAAVTGAGFIGSAADSLGTVTVDGTGSQWNNNGDLRIGSFGRGMLTVQNGGAVSNDYGYIGENEGGEGMVTVEGVGSQWDNNGVLYVGLYGTGTLSIQNGGTVSNDYAYIGASSGEGTVTVDDSASQWNSDGTLYVGLLGTGTLTVQNGGTVSSANGSIGALTGGIGTVTVTGPGSQWSGGSSLMVGTSGTGTLIVAAGGKVTVSSVLMANADSSQGTLNLNGTGGSRGVLETAYITEGSGSGGGTINFNGGILRATADSTDFLQNFEAGDVQIQGGGAFVDTRNFNAGISTALQGTGGLNKLGTGTLTLSGASTYTGPTTVEAGKLVVTGSLTGDVTLVQSGATLAGTGSVQEVTVQSGGTISPGVGLGDIGTLNTGSETWAGGGTFLWDVKAKPAEGTAGTNWDFINMSGGLDIAATSADKFIIGINGSLTGIVPFSLLDWTMLSASDGFDGTFSADKFTLDTTHFTSDIEGSFSLFTQGNSLVLEFVASPEPGRMLLMVLGSTVMLLRRRRQR